MAIRRALKRFCLAFGLCLLAGAPLAAEEICSEETLPGRWKALNSGNVWTFHGDGKLSCAGTCRFTQVTGDPVSWAYEPHANVWSSPIEYIKLEFTKVIFDGVFGSFRCIIDDGGRTLRLESDDDPAMVFQRQ